MTRPSVKLLRSRTWPAVSGVDDEGQVIHYSYAELPGLVSDSERKCPEEPTEVVCQNGTKEVAASPQVRRSNARPDLLNSCCVHRDDTLKLFAEKPSSGTKCEHQVPALMVCDPKKTATLFRHYYPEGGWGYVIVTCSVLVSVLGQGLQLAFGHMVGPAQIKYGVHSTGDIDKRFRKAVVLNNILIVGKNINCTSSRQLSATFQLFYTNGLNLADMGLKMYISINYNNQLYWKQPKSMLENIMVFDYLRGNFQIMVTSDQDPGYQQVCDSMRTCNTYLLSSCCLAEDGFVNKQCYAQISIYRTSTCGLNITLERNSDLRMEKANFTLTGLINGKDVNESVPITYEEHEVRHKNILQLTNTNRLVLDGNLTFEYSVLQGSTKRIFKCGSGYFNLPTS